MAVAVDQHHGFKLYKRFQRCRLLSYSHLDHNILELGHTKYSHSLKRACEAANFHRSFSTPCLSVTTTLEEEFETNPKIEIVSGFKAPRVRALVVEVAMAIASGVYPLPVSSGLGGAYLLRSQSGDNIAVTKPVDEEPLALNNPKGFGGLMLGQPGVKRSVRIGETGIRELAAYLLDHGGFAGVPPSALVKISHVPFHFNNATTVSSTPCKIASLQRFIDHDYDAGELGPSGFSVASVHQIGILDIRLLNLDRHAGNILVKKHDRNSYAIGAAELVPIDHGLCLPEWLDDPYFEWLHWPQALVPFSESEVAYISNLDPFKDAELLRTEIPSLREACIRVLVLCTIFLKRAVASGLCLAAIGEMMSREFHSGEEKPSVLENICAKAKASIPLTFDDNEGNTLTAELGELQLDDGVEDTYDNDALDVSQVSQSYPEISMPQKVLTISKSAGSITRLPDAILSPYDEENNRGNDVYALKAKEGNNGTDLNHKVAGLTRSKSSSGHIHNYETWAISFADMTEDDWELFLKNFKKLLPEYLERTKFLRQKQRLGTSCKF
ncbi:hypothetical protein TIFTF001_022437 [Ficus carica]|uniref:1-phosphatidylinositol 4-kinase n=1 Tax=Ficus carica TaxID=3494 RepID=A0AA88AM12_FICCA|nr:hypothetical protein TIFTF001_022437 [Ficus carica]